MKILSLFFCFISLSVWSQELTLKGIVLDAKTKMGLPDASLTIGNIGVSANSVGKFLFRVSSELRDKELFVTLMGYKTYSLSINQIIDTQNIQIVLEEASEVLSEVTLKTLTASQIIALAYEKIPENFPTTNTLYTGFYRESNYHYQISEKDAKCYYIIEAVTKHNKPSYKNRLPEGDIKLIESRKNIFVDDKVKFIKWYAGVFTPTRFDVAKQRFEFIDPRHLEKYKYEVMDFVTYQNRQIQKISFTPIKSSAEYEGTIYIDVETFAIVKVDYKLTKKGLFFENALGVSSTIVERKYHVNYQPIKNKWYLQSIWQQAIAEDRVANDSVKYTTEYAVTRIDTNTHEKFEYGDRIQYEEVFLTKDTPYQVDFWKNYNIIVPTENEEKLLISTQVQTKEMTETSSEKPKYSLNKKRLGHTRTWLSLGQGLVQSSISNLHITYANPNSSFSLNEMIGLNSTMFSQTMETGYEFHLSKGVYLSLRTSLGLGTLKHRGLQIGLSSEWRVSKPEKRPLYLILGAYYALLSSVKKIRNIDNPEDARIKLNEITFESKSVSVNIGKEQQGLNLSLGFGYELNQRNFLFFNVNYFAANTKTEGIYVKEKGFYFFTKPKETVISPQNNNLILQEAGKVLKNIPFRANIFTSFGYKFTLGK